MTSEPHRLIQILDPKYFTLGQVLYFPDGKFIGRVEYVTESLSTAHLKFEIAHCRTSDESFVEISQFALVGKTAFTREGLKAAGIGRNPDGLPPVPAVTLGSKGNGTKTTKLYVIGMGARIFRARELQLGTITRISTSDMEVGGCIAQTDFNNVIRPSQLNEGILTHGARKHND